jgi:hypothetical protein
MCATPITLQRLPLRALSLGNSGQNPLGTTEAVLKTKLRSITQGAAIKPGVWEALEFMPKAVTGLTEQHLEIPEVLTHIEECPVAAFYTLVHGSRSPTRYAKLSDRLEAAFLADGDLVASYMSWIRQAELPGVDPFKFRSNLLVHPIHGIRWAKAVGDEQYGADMLLWAQENAQTHASAAWAIVCAYQEDPEAWRSILQLDPLYMVASAGAFGMKFSLDEATTPIEGRWLYLLLLHDGCEDRREAETRLFATDPFWATEWILHQDLAITKESAIKVFDGMRAWLERGHPLVQALADSWRVIHERLTAKTEEGNGASEDTLDDDAPEDEEDDSADAPDIFDADISEDEDSDGGGKTARD